MCIGIVGIVCVCVFLLRETERERDIPGTQNAPCFYWKGPCFGWLKPNNRGQRGSRYTQHKGGGIPIAPPQHIEPKSDLKRRSCRWSNTISAVVKIWCSRRITRKVASKSSKIFQRFVGFWTPKKKNALRKNDARPLFLFKFQTKTEWRIF